MTMSETVQLAPHHTTRHFMIRLTLIFVSLFTFLIISVSPSVYAQKAGETENGKVKDKDYTETYRLLNLFGDVFERARAQYVEPVEDKELIENAVNGMLTSLDPHSSYLNAESFEDMQVNTRGSFGGLGIEVTMENGFVKVVSPIDDTPAFRAGIKAGDYITHIDGESVPGMSLGDAVDKMRGKVGTKIHLKVRREGAMEDITKTITRDIIKIRSVRHQTEGKTGYVRITTFNQNTFDGVKNAIRDIKKDLGDDLRGYVIDLRNNPGGLLDQAISVADVFLDQGEIVSTRGRDKNDIERDNATDGDLTDGKPLVVLINGGSASASEIVAGALQDHKRAILIGTQSFGKGSVQTIIPISGHGAMRLTTARYYTPSGRSIQAKGIKPDITVEQARLEKLDGQRLRESDLRGALDKSEKDKSSKSKSKKGKKDEEKDEEKPVDYQLNRALDLINGLSLYTDPKRMPLADEQENARKTND